MINSIKLEKELIMSSNYLGLIYKAMDLLSGSYGDEQGVVLIDQMEKYLKDHQNISAEELADVFRSGGTTITSFIPPDDEIINKFFVRLSSMKRKAIISYKDYYFAKGLLLSYFYGNDGYIYGSSSLDDCLIPEFEKLQQRRGNIRMKIKKLYSELLVFEKDHVMENSLISSYLLAGLTYKRKWYIPEGKKKADRINKIQPASFRLEPVLVQRFKDCCKKNEESYTAALTKLMNSYIDKNK